MRRAAPLVLALVAAGWSRIDIPETGHMGKSRIEVLLAVPEGLARMSRDDRESWRHEATESVISTARTEGRLDAACAITFVKVDSAADVANLRVDYWEGPLYAFGRVTVEFPEREPQAAPVPASVASYSGQDFEQRRINSIVQETQQFYRHQGWLDATMTYSLETRPDSHLVDMRMEVRLGRIAIFERMDVRFHDKHLTPASRLENLWPVERGDTIRNEDVASYNKKLAQTRLFSLAKVTRTPSATDTTRTDVVVDIGERVPGNIDLALSWEQTYGWGVGAVIRHRNVMGSFNELSLQTKMAQGKQNVRLGLGTPLFWGSPIALDDGITVEQLEAGLGDSSFYREFTVSNDGTFSFLPTSWSSVSLKLGTQRDTKYLNTGASSIAYEFSTDLGGTLDFRDEPFDPVEGWILRGDVGLGGQVYPHDTTFVWVQAQARLYQPLFWRFLSAYALEGGEFLNPCTFDGSKIFWLGGSRSVRSYGYDDLRATANAAYGLQPRYVRASGELRMNLPWNLQTVGFLDWARIWNKGESPDLLEISKAAMGYGIGLRYRISFLSLRLDYCLGRGPEVWAFDLAQAI